MKILKYWSSFPSVDSNFHYINGSVLGLIAIISTILNLLAFFYLSKYEIKQLKSLIIFFFTVVILIEEKSLRNTHAIFL